MYFGIVALFIAAFGAAATGTYFVRRFALARSIFDIPNERSSHSVPTPRGGGLSVVLVWLAGQVVLLATGFVTARFFIATSVGATAIALVGWIDDRKSLSARARLLVQVGAAVLFVGLVQSPAELDFGFATIPLHFTGPVFSVIWLVWLTNLFNFMDGIDGIAGSEAVVAGLGLSVLAFLSSAFDVGLSAALLAFAAGGFLVWNWPPAKIFMGDVCSGFLGFTFGALVLSAHATTGVSVLLLALPFSVFLLDATFTLLRRLFKGERVFDAHKSHIYQRLVQKGWTHKQVTTLVILINGALVGLALVGWTLRNLIGVVAAVSLGGLVVVARLALNGR